MAVDDVMPCSQSTMCYSECRDPEIPCSNCVQTEDHRGIREASPLIAAAMASAIPVLPDVASISLSPGLMTPFLSASGSSHHRAVQTLHAIWSCKGMFKESEHARQEVSSVRWYHLLDFCDGHASYPIPSIIDNAGLSLTLPAALFPSSFNRMTLLVFPCRR